MSEAWVERYAGDQDNVIAARLRELEHDNAVSIVEVYVNGDHIAAWNIDTLGLRSTDEVTIAWWEHDDAITLLGRLARV